MFPSRAVTLAEFVDTYPERHAESVRPRSSQRQLAISVIPLYS